MKEKRIVRLKSGLMAMLMLSVFCLSACTKVDPIVVPTELDKVDESKIKAGVNSSDFEIVEHKLEDFQEIDGRIRQAVEAEASSDEVMALVNEMLDMYKDTMNAHELATIYYDMDPSNVKYKEVRDYCKKYEAQISDVVGMCGYFITNSSYNDLFKDNLSELDYNYFKGYQELYSENTDEITNKNIELCDRYKKINSKLTYDEDGYCNNISDYKEEIAEIYSQMILLRNEKAKVSGFDSFELLQKKNYNRDYTPTQTKKFAEYIKEYMVPVYKKCSDNLKKEDLKTVGKSLDNCSMEDCLKIIYNGMDNISPEVQEAMYFLMENNLLLVTDNEESYGAGYTTYLFGYDEPVMYISDLFLDGWSKIDTPIHEFGHFYEKYKNNDSNFAIISPVNDVAETNSQGMEALYSYILPEVLGEKNGKIVADKIILSLIDTAIYSSLVNEFESKAYELETPTIDNLCQLFIDVSNEYGYEYEMNGKDEYGWMSITHLFDYPFYYVGYSYSAVAALELWQMAGEDFDKACAVYEDIIDISRDTQMLGMMNHEGFGNPFDEKVISALAEDLEKKIE